MGVNEYRGEKGSGRAIQMGGQRKEERKEKRKNPLFRRQGRRGKERDFLSWREIDRTPPSSFLLPLSI